MRSIICASLPISVLSRKGRVHASSTMSVQLQKFAACLHSPITDRVSSHLCFTCEQARSHSANYVHNYIHTVLGMMLTIDESELMSKNLKPIFVRRTFISHRWVTLGNS